MKKGKIVSKAALLVVLVYPILFSGCLSLSADDEKNADAREKDFVITKTDKGVVINLYKGKNKNIRLPSEIKGMPVIGISDSAFLGKQLTSVIIPNSVTRIGAFAFASNQLTSVTIPNSVTAIEEFAFAINKLTSVTIPDSVTLIGDSAFFDNQLTSVTIPDSVTLIGEGAFFDNQLTSVSVFGATHVGKGAFGKVKVTVRPESDFKVVPDPNGGVMITEYLDSKQEVNIPPDIQNQVVTRIGKSAFHNKRLTSVIIPNSVRNCPKITYTIMIIFLARLYSSIFQEPHTQKYSRFPFLHRRFYAL